MGTGIERIVLDFVHAAYGERMDVDAMTALMADDFVWQLNVPLSPIIYGRDAAPAELEKHNQLASGMVEGSEIRTVISNDDTVVVERLDVNLIAGTRVTFMSRLSSRCYDAITCWREYWDTGDIARHLGSDPIQMFEQIGS